MMTNLMKLLRAVIAALILAFVAVPVAEAGERERTVATSRTTESRPKRTGDSEKGLLVIAGAVALFLLLAWVAVRIGDNSRSADKVPS